MLTRLASEADADPRLLEQAEERLFALRAAARKHAVAVAELPALLDTLCARLAALETGAAEVVALEQAVREAREAYSEARRACGDGAPRRRNRLDRAVAKELPPLRLDKARFRAEVVGAGRSRLGTGRHRCGAVPDRHQSGPGAWPVGADRLGRRVVAVDAGAEGCVVVGLAGADIGVR